ncbi:hypothetical protein YC2023_062897 [Brassica napus]
MPSTPWKTASKMDSFLGKTNEWLFIEAANFEFGHLAQASSPSPMVTSISSSTW